VDGHGLFSAAIRRSLGVGRCGGGDSVWRAYDPAINRVVARKVLPAQFNDDHTFQERFRREARAAARLDEPHVVPIHDFGEVVGRLYVTMRLIKGRDFEAMLRDGPLPPARAIRKENPHYRPRSGVDAEDSSIARP
jgi:serine/threonine protein kinase